ncbi:diacylglycerol kinase family protein|uniref:Diacylglycerol kinase (ATP) n=1 Tax=Dendrosporobacter quercicolus TaxID=146817 RepID=A0A1G9MQP5_9FIRM|nr:diacylglycerol kinase family protein [Dendrosporobacter quercicolus]NSL47110.1 diacylglycerol kinase family protein [Dendrosporobacter quercicolus DSM 1736]SDL76570.1 diacylglycerol kinase (ATP) [Dendrosporobacter quercicolus]
MARWIKAFKNAGRGFSYCLGSERNFRIHCLAAGAMLIVAWRLNFDRMEMMVLAIVIAGVFIAEMFNTALEKTADMIKPEFHPLAKIVKDVAAGAVLVAAVAAAFIGCILIYGKLF